MALYCLPSEIQVLPTCMLFNNLIRHTEFPTSQKLFSNEELGCIQDFFSQVGHSELWCCSTEGTADACVHAHLPHQCLPPLDAAISPALYLAVPPSHPPSQLWPPPPPQS